MSNVIEARKREKVGKSYAKKYRRQGFIPGVYYKQGKEAIHLLFEKKTLTHFLADKHGLIDLKVDGEKEPLKCVVKDVQYDPVSDEIIHVDFYGVVMGEKLTVSVPVVLVGTPKGVKEGGILEHLIRELEIECLPRYLPEQLEIDVSGLQIGDSIHVKDLQFENIRILDDPDETICVIEAPKVAVEEVVTEELEEELQEPEVITEKKKEETEEEEA